jgi:hypothetical protein
MGFLSNFKYTKYFYITIIFLAKLYLENYNPMKFEAQQVFQKGNPLIHL